MDWLGLLREKLSQDQFAFDDNHLIRLETRHLLSRNPVALIALKNNKLDKFLSIHVVLFSAGSSKARFAWYIQKHSRSRPKLEKNIEKENDLNNILSRKGCQDLLGIYLTYCN